MADRAPGAHLFPGLDPGLLARAEDAGLNASAPPEQRWLDGWLVRLSPAKAQRARCVNALAEGRRPIAEKLAECRDLYRAAGLPMLVRITPFSQPATLDQELAEAGFDFHDDTRVMVCADLGVRPAPEWPADLTWRTLGPGQFARAVGRLRGTPASEIEAHAERLQAAPVPFQAFAVEGAGNAELLVCGQFAREGSLAGLYDIVTAPGHRRRGLARLLCEHMLSLIASENVGSAYLQVGADNAPARALYHWLGFVDGYSYHYRIAR